MAFPLGAIISAGSSLIGGILGDKKDDKRAARQEQLQKDFAQQGIRWRVADAKAAGIHPLFAMGAQVPTYSPTNFVGSNLAASVGAAGQDIGRAIDATRSGPARIEARLGALTVRRAELENDLLASQIARLNQTPNPSFPVGGTRALPGQGNSPLVDVVPQEVTATPPGRPQVEPGQVPDVGHSRSNTGYPVTPSSDVKQKVEDNIIQEITWAIRNNILPSLGMNYTPPNVPLKKDHFWYFDPIRQEYRQVSKRIKDW